MVPNAEIFAKGVRVIELSRGVTLILGVLTNLAAIASVRQSLSIMLSQGGVGFGTGLGAPAFLNFDLLIALLSLLILCSPSAKDLLVDFRLASHRPGLSPVLLNRRDGGGESGPAPADRRTAPEGRPPPKG